MSENNIIYIYSIDKNRLNNPIGHGYAKAAAFEEELGNLER